MAKNNPFISICIPTFNRAAYLSETIKSVISQTYPHFELLIINDGCTDNTDEVVGKFNDKRIKYLKNKKNLGYIKTMNKGTMLAQAEWIMHLSDDDKMRPTMLEEMVKALQQYPEYKIGFVVPQSANINERGELINEPKKQLESEESILLKPKEFIFNFTLYGKKIRDQYKFNTSFPSTLFNKKILIELGMSSEDVPVSHDVLIESMICLLYPVLVLDKPLFEYRVHENWGSSLNRKGTYLKEYQAFLGELFSFVEIKKITFGYDFQKYAYKSLITYLFAPNGGLIRISGKFQGSYFQRLRKISEYIIFGLSHDKFLMYSIMFYLVVFSSFLPQRLIINIGRVLKKA